VSNAFIDSYHESSFEKLPEYLLIKTFSGVDVSAPLNASTNAESFCAAPMTTTKEEEARHAPASDAQA